MYLSPFEGALLYTSFHFLIPVLVGYSIKYIDKSNPKALAGFVLYYVYVYPTKLLSDELFLFSTDYVEIISIIGLAVVIAIACLAIKFKLHVKRIFLSGSIRGLVYAPIIGALLGNIVNQVLWGPSR